jgi:hypothetical protein
MEAIQGLIASLASSLWEFVFPAMRLKTFVVKNFIVLEYPTWSAVRAADAGPVCVCDILHGSDCFRIYAQDFSGIAVAIAKLKRLESSPAGIDIVVDASRWVRGTCGAVLRVRDFSDPDAPETVMQASFITFREAGDVVGDKKHD